MPISPTKLKANREAANLTQQQAAERLGWKQQAIQRIEAGRRNDPKLSTIEQLARLYRCRLEDLTE